MIGTLSGGWLADHWHRLGVLRLSYGLSALIAALLAVAPDIAVLLLAVFALGIALFAPFAGLTTPLFGLLADRHGLTTALVAIAVIPALACALSLLVRDPRA